MRRRYVNHKAPLAETANQLAAHRRQSRAYNVQHTKDRRLELPYEPKAHKDTAAAAHRLIGQARQAIIKRDFKTALKFYAKALETGELDMDERQATVKMMEGLK